MSKTPIAIVISDIHYNIHSIPLANAAIDAATFEASVLNVPLIVAGDLHDTKANMRGECVKAMIEAFNDRNVKTFILIGNHDKINEKSEEHSLEFLRNYVQIIDRPTHIRGLYIRDLDIQFVPYQHDVETFKRIVEKFQPGTLIVMHQGIKESWSGDYVFDKTAIPAELLKDFKVISGHYHRHQTVGTVTYCGSPYTQSFGEASDGPKGYLVLYSDGSFLHKPLNLRRHRIIEIKAGDDAVPSANEGDLVWLKVHGSQSELDKVKKEDYSLCYGLNYKLDKIPDDSVPLEIKADTLTAEQILDTLIDSTSEPDDFKVYLKEVWREIIE